MNYLNSALLTTNFANLIDTKILLSILFALVLYRLLAPLVDLLNPVYAVLSIARALFRNHHTTSGRVRGRPVPAHVIQMLNCAIADDLKSLAPPSIGPQIAAVMLDRATVCIELPGPDVDVVPGVRWGEVEAFPTPAYWAYQAIARRITGSVIVSRLGRTLQEEIGACLLGGHGIPSNVGLAAFESLKRHGAFGTVPPTQQQLLEWLTAPIIVGEKAVRYRFAKQKSRYLAHALSFVAGQSAPMASGRVLRDWLLGADGIGYKTASWIARNWMDADDVAILDIHILRAGYLAGVFPADLTVARHYLQLEELFLAFCRGIGVRASELDAVIWSEMMMSRQTIESVSARLVMAGISLPDYFPKSR